MLEFWNDRYAAEAYAYGVKPNDFLASQIKNLDKGKALFPGEGEGRNAVFTASMGWEVTAFDYSESAMDKALKLATDNKVSIDYQISSYQNFQPLPGHYDLVALIYTHTEPIIRQALHKKLMASLKVGGKLILEVFSKNQLGKTSGGPKNIDMLYSKAELMNDFEDLKIEMIEEAVIQLNEGEFHQGEASVVRLLAVKD